MSRNLRVICWALRVMLSVLFLWAGIAKLTAPQVFAEGVLSFRFFPEELVNIIVIGAPLMELLAGALLLIPSWWRVGSLCSGLLSVVFAMLFAWALTRGVAVECSCFGTTSLSSNSTVFGFSRALGMVAISGFLYVVSLSGRVEGGAE